MRKFILIITSVIGSSFAFAQQDPQFTQYMYNKLFMNPAYAGMKQAYCFTGILRQQWAGLDGSPQTGVFSADMVARKLSGGVGLNLMYDKLGFEVNERFAVDYSFHHQFNFGTIGLGVEAGLFSKRLGPTGSEQWVATTNWMSDSHIPTMIKKDVPDMGLGVWYESRQIWFGASSTHLGAQLIDDGTGITPPNTTHDLRYQMARHYFITGGCTLNPGQLWEFKPSFLIKSDATITSFDLNLQAMFDDQFWGAISYRWNDAVCPMIGYQWKGSGTRSLANDVRTDNSLRLSDYVAQPTVKMGFAYDYGVSRLRDYHSGSFELFVSYCFPYNPLLHRVGHQDVRLFQ